MKKSTLSLTAIALSLATSGVFASTNLVNNGSFEENTITARSGQWQLFNSISGWQRSSNAKFELQATKLGIINAQDGSQYLELDSTANYAIQQTLATTAGKEYDVSFYYSARVDGNNSTNKAKVFWQGQELAQINSANRGWTKYSFTVTADSDAAKLTFSGAGKSDSLGGFIDNVVVTEVPEPCAVTTGLYGINDYGSDEAGYVYHFNLDTDAVSVVAGVSRTASNIATKDGVLYFMEQLDKSTKASQIVTLDLATNTQSVIADATSYPIYRSAVTPDGLSLRATSKTYMYDYDLATGDKTVLGKLNYAGDSFAHGDIAYSADNNVLYVLTGKALYTVDQGTLELTLVGEHGVNWASGIAISDNGTIYVSGRVSGENAKIYTLDQNTAEATFVMDGPAHINDLTYVSDAVCSVE